jgi:hypothetical protein
LTELTWYAKWIWSGPAAEQNSYRIFRKSFDWPTDRSCIPVAYISADYQYKLYLNGRLLTNGPAPSTRVRQTYDVVPITLSTDQANVITVVVSYPHAPLFSGFRNRGGFLFQMDDIVSDASWLVAVEQPWDKSSQRTSVQQGFAEYYDARKEPQGAFGGDIIGDEWRHADIVCDANDGAWPLLEERDIPQPTFRRIDREMRMLEWGNCTPGNGDTVSQRMQDEALRPLTRGVVKRSADPSEPVEIVPDGDDLYVTYDFGQEVSGFVKVCVEGDNSGAVLDLGYGEVLRIGETASGFYLTGRASELNYADQVTLRDGVTVFRGFAHRAFRYMRIAFRGLVSPLKIHFVTLVESTYPVNRLGSFACSDARLEQIWEIGRRTLQLCMDDRYMDCPWRERAQWIGDARVEAIAAAMCFGDTLLHARFLRKTAEAQYADGRTDPVGPGEWDEHQKDHPIHGFTCLWIASIWDYYQLTADGDLPEQLLPAVLRSLDWLQTYATGPGGLLADVGPWNFTDWAPGLSGQPTGIAAPLNLFYIDALRAASRMAAFAGDTDVAASLDMRRDLAANSFVDLFWNDTRGVFVDAIVNGVQSETASQHVSSLVLLFGLGTPSQRARIASWLLTDSSLTQVGSPYFSFYLLGALYSIGKHDAALDFIGDKWGMMLDAGATSWWETFVNDTTSHCHAWSIGPTIDLLTEYLGVSAGEPGFALVKVAPHPSGLAWAKGVVPIPSGDVVCSWRDTPERFTLDISTPVGIHLQATLPAGPNDTIIVDSEPLTEDAITNRTSSSVELCVMPGSGYRFEVLKGG